MMRRWDCYWEFDAKRGEDVVGGEGWRCVRCMEYEIFQGEKRPRCD